MSESRGTRYCRDIADELGLDLPDEGFLPRECCPSCHEDADEGYEPLIELDDGSQVCCAIARLADEALGAWDENGGGL